MLDAARDYVFTNGATDALIHGGNSPAMVPRHEHWLWMNECMRTLQYQDSVEVSVSGARYNASLRAKNSPFAMAPSRAVWERWKSQANEFVQKSRLVGVQTGLWTYGSSDYRYALYPCAILPGQNISYPTVCTLPGGWSRYETRASLGQPFQSDRWPCLARPGETSGQAARDLFGNYGVPYYVSNRTHGILHASFMQFGGGPAGKWYRNGVEGLHPSKYYGQDAIDAGIPSSQHLVRAGFFGARDPMGSEYFDLVYFREVTDEHDATFHRDDKLPFEIPLIPWTRGPSGQDYTMMAVWVYVVFEVAVCALWRVVFRQRQEGTNQYGVQYPPYAYPEYVTYDLKMFDSVVCPGRVFGMYAPGTVVSDLYADGADPASMKAMAEQALQYARIQPQNAHTDPSYVIHPDCAGTLTLWSKEHIGYHLMIGIRGLYVIVSASGRDVGF